MSRRYVIHGISPHAGRKLLAALDQTITPFDREFVRKRVRSGGQTIADLIIQHNGPVSIYTARGIEREQEQESIILDVPYLIERGVAVYSNGTIGILCSTDDVAYLQSVGDTWPWGVQERAQGLFLQVPGDAQCAFMEQTPPHWIGPIPTLGEYNHYFHLLWQLFSVRQVQETLERWVNDANLDPGRMTGLMQLAGQARQANFSLHNLIPSGLGGRFDPRFHGLLRYRNTAETTLDYWLVYVGPNGVKACLLEWDSTVACLVGGLYAGAFSGDQAISAEGCVLVTLRLPATPIITTLKTLEEMEETAYSGSKNHAAHGWAFSPQKIGTASEGQLSAITVTTQSTILDLGTGFSNVRAWRWARNEANFDFENRTPSVVVQTLDSGTAYQTVNNVVWVPASSESATGSHTIFVSNNILTLSQPGYFFAQYRDSGKTWWSSDSSYSASHAADPPLATMNGCQFSGGSAESHQYYRSLFTAAVSGAVEMDFDAIYGHGVTQKQRITVGGPSTFKSNVRIKGFSWNVQQDWEFTECVAPQEGSGYTFDGVCKIKVCRTDGWSYTEEWTSSLDGGICAIITDNPNVVIVAKYAGRRRGARAEGWHAWATRLHSVDVTDHDHIPDGTYNAPQGGSYDIAGWSVGGWLTYCQITASGALNCSYGGDNIYSGLDMRRNTESNRESYSEGVANEWVYTNEAKLCGARGNTELGGSHSDWAAWCRPDLYGGSFGAIRTGLFVAESYSGELVYTPYPGSDIENTAGYNPAIGNGMAIRHLL